jgi:hypothetical protein
MQLLTGSSFQLLYDPHGAIYYMELQHANDNWLTADMAQPASWLKKCPMRMNTANKAGAAVPPQATHSPLLLKRQRTKD